MPRGIPGPHTRCTGMRPALDAERLPMSLLTNDDTSSVWYASRRHDALFEGGPPSRAVYYFFVNLINNWNTRYSDRSRPHVGKLYLVAPSCTAATVVRRHTRLVGALNDDIDIAFSIAGENESVELATARGPSARRVLARLSRVAHTASLAGGALLMEHASQLWGLSPTTDPDTGTLASAELATCFALARHGEPRWPARVCGTPEDALHDVARRYMDEWLYAHPARRSPAIVPYRR